MSTLLSLFSIAQAHAVTISMSIPGSNPNSSTTSPGAFVSNVYQFALAIAGVLAFGVIIYGGIKYMTSSGNPSGQSDAKEWIEAALLGLLLLAGAYFILKVINPQLVDLNLPQSNVLPKTNIPAPTPSPTP
jgi:Type IV secretion system pilin